MNRVMSNLGLSDPLYRLSEATSGITVNITQQYNINGTTHIHPSGEVAEIKKVKTTMVFISSGEDGYFIADCPALPGCISQGKTREEALSNIKEAIELCWEVRRDRGYALPEFVEVQV